MVTLEICNLRFDYPSRNILNGLSFTVTKGEIVSFVGRNGAGKSTLLKCINNLISPSEGVVLIDSTDVKSMKLIDRGKRFGYLSQQNDFLFSTTVFETVLNGRYPHSPLNITKKDKEITAEVIAEMGLQNFALRQINTLSGGELQMVLIARAIAQGAKVLLFDEPTNNLDLKHQIEIMKLIRSLAKEKKITVLMAIHDLNLASSFSDKILILHNSKVFSYGNPAEVFTIETIKEVFGVTVRIYDHHGCPHIVPVDV
ncbi:MAG: ABC transporter ATP-binding protein [Chitinispirillaceae bacterium]|nr:ABC transporter ATP-binding protein [Chitinispirillaceae bacterium]